jgi:hypothetical protein
MKNLNMKNLIKKLLISILPALFIGEIVYAVTPFSLFQGGTGQSTAQNAINALTAVSSATNEHVLTKDTATGNAIWKAAPSGMVYPGAGVAVSTGSAWTTSLSTDGSGDCGSGAVCLGDHTHSGYLTSLSGAVLTSQATPQTIGDTTNRLTKLWATDITVTNAITGSVTGNAGTASALAANPSDCAANQFATTIAANGNLTCAALADADIPNDITINTATALAANGANCEAGNAPLGVDASGAAEGCFAVVTGTPWTGMGYLTANQSISLSGDVSGSGTTAITTTIGENKILESMLKAVDSASDEECLTYETTTGDFEWQACGSESTTVADTTTLDLTLTGTEIKGDVVVLKDLVAGTGLSGGSNDVLPGADGDITLAVDTTEIDGARTWGAADGASITWTWNLVANDPSMTFGPSSVKSDVPFSIGYGSNSSGVLYIYEDSDDGTNNASFTVPALAADTDYILPANDGDANQFLETDGSGTLSWATALLSGGTLTSSNVCQYDGTGIDCNIAVNAGTDLTADLEEETHAAEHAVGAADTVFPSDPNADKYLMWDDDPGTLVWAAGAGGLASTDIDTSTELYAILTDETGSASGTPLLVFNTNPVLTGATLAGILADNDDMVFEVDADNNGSNKFSFTDGASSEILSITEAGLLTVADDIVITGSDLSVGAAGVKLTGDGDGALTLLGLGNGFDEDITLNLDDVENTLGISSSTGLATIDFGTMALTIGEGKLADSTIVSADVKNGTIVVADTAITAGRSLTWSTDDMVADAELYTDTKCIYFEDPTADDDFKSIWYAKQAATITSMWCESDQTVNADLQVDDGSAADVNGTDLVCDSTPPEDTSMGGDATLASGDRLDLAVESVSGTPTWVSICFTFSYDD